VRANDSRTESVRPNDGRAESKTVMERRPAGESAAAATRRAGDAEQVDVATPNERQLLHHDPSLQPRVDGDWRLACAATEV
jgi:hypothetical protein